MHVYGNYNATIEIMINIYTHASTCTMSYMTSIVLHNIFLSDSTGNLIISPATITLQPNETSATVNATIIDDQFPEDDFMHHVHMNSNHGSQTINITILDNDCEY